MRVSATSAVIAACGVFAVLHPVRVAAQTCAAPAYPLFEFQVDRPAVYAGDTTRVPRPGMDPALAAAYRAGLRPVPLLVQFVVDTLGIPDPRSLRVLNTPSTTAADSLRPVLGGWRFRPAVAGGCRVPQVVQTMVIH